MDGIYQLSYGLKRLFKSEEKPVEISWNHLGSVAAAAASIAVKIQNENVNKNEENE